MSSAIAQLSGEERIGVGTAVVAHVALALALAWHATRDPPLLAPPERITVSLATDVALEATAPDPSADPAAALAPELAALPEPPQQVEAAPPPRRTSDRRMPVPQPTRTTRPTPAPSATRPPRGAEIGENFLEGTSNNRGNTGSPATTFGPTERAALESAITRQLRPNWSAPRGTDWELLVSRVSWRLNRDGTLNGTPSCTQVGRVTPSNQPQVTVHCEAAIRAVVQTARGRFNLPDQFYSRWDELEWDFDRRL